jgi:hypothetical protein
MSAETAKFAWRKSSGSKTINDCVEAAPLPGGGAVLRDSKLGDGSPVLSFTASEWTAFLAGARGGEFDFS